MGEGKIGVMAGLLRLKTEDLVFCLIKTPLGAYEWCMNMDIIIAIGRSLYGLKSVWRSLPVGQSR